MNRSRRGRPEGAVVGYLAAIGLSVAVLLAASWPPVVDIQKTGARLFAPVREAIAAGTQAVDDFFATVGQIGSLRADNAALTSELAAARARIAALEGTAIENAQLRQLLGIAGDATMQFSPARVVARDTQLGVWEVTISGGSRDGIRVGMPVVAPASDGAGALVGTVVATDRERATVRLIVDTRARVIAAGLDSGALGLVGGQPGGQLLMRDVLLTEVVATGESIVTAGLAEDGAPAAYPRGLLIGSVTATEADANGLTQTVFVAPAVDPRHLDWLLVITAFSAG